MNYPKKLLIYVCDYDKENDAPIFAAAKNADEIPEDISGEMVGVYVLNQTMTLTVRRELK